MHRRGQRNRLWNTGVFSLTAGQRPAHDGRFVGVVAYYFDDVAAPSILLDVEWVGAASFGGGAF
jgi:hypothetical protein